MIRLGNFKVLLKFKDENFILNVFLVLEKKEGKWGLNILLIKEKPTISL